MRLLTVVLLTVAIAGGVLVLHQVLITEMIEQEVAASLLAANPTPGGLLLALAFVTVRLSAMVAIPFIGLLCLFKPLTSLWRWPLQGEPGWERR